MNAYKNKFRKIWAGLLTAALALTAFSGLSGPGLTQAQAAEEKRITITEATSLESGKDYIFLNSTRNVAMSYEQGRGNRDRSGVNVSLDGEMLSYAGDDIRDLLWTCETGSDGKIKLYSQKTESEWKYLHYSGCDLVQKSTVGGEVHAYDNTGKRLYSWWGDSVWDVYYDTAVGFSKCQAADAQYYDTNIYAYEVGCTHESKTHHGAAAATCTADGNIEYWECSDCGQMFADEGCTEAVSEVTKKALGHDWDEGVVTKEPTATETGILTYTCKRDASHTYTEDIPKKGQEQSNILTIKETQVTALENGKTYIIMSYPGGGKAMSAQTRSVAESSGSYNYLKPVNVTISGDKAVFDNADEAQLSKLKAEVNPDNSSQFRFSNDGAWIYKYYSMIEMRSDQSIASWFTYSTLRGLTHVNSNLVSSYPYIAYQSNVYKGWTDNTSPIRIYEVVEAQDAYTVNFDTAGGTAIEAAAVNAGDAVKKPVDPTREDYIFAGWYTDKACTQEYDFTKPVNESFTLYAKWESATGDSPVVYVQRTKLMQPGKTYIIANADHKLAMSAENGDANYPSSRAGKAITVSTEDGKTKLTFGSIEEKNACLWESGSGPESGQVTLSNGGKMLGSYLEQLHWPAMTDEDGKLKENVYFYADGYVLREAEKGYAIYYRAYLTGFRPGQSDVESCLYEVVDEDYVHTHTFVKVPGTAATCEKSGVKDYWQCAECGQLAADREGATLISQPEVIPALGHSWSAWRELNKDQHQRVCGNDPAHTETAPHNWNDGEVTKPATEKEAGEMTFTCADCGAERKEAIAVTTGTCPVTESVGYQLSVTPAKELTAGKQYLILSQDKSKATTSVNIKTQLGGYRLAPKDVTYEADDGIVIFDSAADSTLSIWTSEGADDMMMFKQAGGYLYNYMAYIWCGEGTLYDGSMANNTFSYQYDESLGYGTLAGNPESYKVGYDSDYDAFCAVPGLYCSVFEVREIIGYTADNSHHLVRTAAKDPTCTAEGNTEYYKCSKCGQIYQDEAGKKKIEIEDTVVSPLGHDLILTKEKAPGCETEGNSAYYTCSRCGSYFSDAEGKHEIREGSWIKAATGHDWGEWETETEALCEKGGEAKRTCRNCGNKETRVIPPGGHDYKLAAHVDAGCENDGFDLYRCSKCDAEVKRNEVQAKGHSWGSWTVTRAASLIEDGERIHTCTVCKEKESGVIPKLTEDCFRIAGETRYTTGTAIMNVVMNANGAEKVDSIIVTTGKNYADALSGSYLAKKKNAPILIIDPTDTAQIREITDYIAENLNADGTVYILGGTAAVPDVVEENLDAYAVKRLDGATRYDTNLAILKEAGVGTEEILVCTGTNFADSLSASATGKPILLVGNKLTGEQETWLKSLSVRNYTIIGGTSAVNASVEKQVRRYAWKLDRISGADRYDTSVQVAEKYFPKADEAILTVGTNYPDGLCGAPLALTEGCPLLLATETAYQKAEAYCKKAGVHSGYVLGGAGLISDRIAKRILQM